MALTLLLSPSQMMALQTQNMIYGCSKTNWSCLLSSPPSPNHSLPKSLAVILPTLFGSPLKTPILLFPKLASCKFNFNLFPLKRAPIPSPLIFIEPRCLQIPQPLLVDPFQILNLFPIFQQDSDLTMMHSSPLSPLNLTPYHPPNFLITFLHMKLDSFITLKIICSLLNPQLNTPLNPLLPNMVEAIVVGTAVAVMAAPLKIVIFPPKTTIPLKNDTQIQCDKFATFQDILPSLA